MEHEAKKRRRKEKRRTRLWMGRRKNKRKRSQDRSVGVERGKSKHITREEEVYQEEARGWEGRENYIFRHFKNFNLTFSHLKFLTDYEIQQKTE